MLTLEKISERLLRIDEKIEEYLSELTRNDIKEEVLEELSSSDDREKALLAKIGKMQMEIERLKEYKEQMESEGKKYLSPSDKYARLMQGREGKLPSYNVQLVVDEANKMIADSEVYTEERDSGLLLEMTGSIEEEYGELPGSIQSDKGYYNPDIIEETERAKGINVFVPVPSSKRDTEPIKFIYDKDKVEYECSAGKVLKLLQKGKKKHKSYTDVYRCVESEGCRLRVKCTKSSKGRLYHRYHSQEWRDKYKLRMLGSSAKEKIRKRKGIVEHPFGTIKNWLGRIPFNLRGNEKVAN